MNPKNSQDLFNKIRSQFTNIRLGDENGAATADPSKAVFFEFEFTEDADTFGSVSISLADGENMKVYYNRDLVNKIDEDSRDEWYAFLKELKDFAVEHQLRFDVRDITKSNLTKQDYQNLADTNKTVNTDEMSEELARITKLAGVNEGLTGSAKRSYENLDATKLIIRHTGKVDETVPGARSRQIQSLYIENEDGERFKYPMTHLAGARAMMRHVANGGRPHDEFGEHIIKTSEDIAKLNSFARYVANKDQLNDNAGDIISQTKLKLENLREYMRNLSKQKHYEAHCKTFRKSEDQELDADTVAKLREKFTMTNLDKRVEDAFPLINKVMAELENSPKEDDGDESGKEGFDYPQGGKYGYKAERGSGTGVMGTMQVNVTIHNRETDETMYIKDMNYLELEKGDEQETLAMIWDENRDLIQKEDQVNELEPDAEPIDAPIEPPVDHAPIVQSFLTDPDKKLVLRKDDSADKMLKVTKFTDKNTMLSSILSDIASRLLTKSGEEDRVANFASRVADEMEQEKSSTFKPTPDYMKNKKIAIQLAKRYIDDYKKMEKDPEYEKEVRMEPGAFAPKKDLKGKAKEQEAFEGWVDSMMDEGGIKPYVSMSRNDDDGKMMYNVLDRNEKTIFASKDEKEATAFLRRNFDKLRTGEMQVAEYAKMGNFPRDPEIAKKDKENATKLAVTQMDKEMGTPAFKRMKSGDPRYVDKTKKEEMTDKEVDKFHTELDKVVHKHIGHSSDEKKEKEDMKKEGNEFALAVQKAKAAGMKAGDKFKVGDKEYTLKDAIELAGLQLEEFFSEEEIAYDNQIDRIKNLAFYQ